MKELQVLCVSRGTYILLAWDVVVLHRVYETTSGPADVIFVSAYGTTEREESTWGGFNRQSLTIWASPRLESDYSNCT